MSMFICYLCNTGEHPHGDGQKCKSTILGDSECYCSNTMSKSAFYASKESLRKTRENDFLRARELEKFLDQILDDQYENTYEIKMRAKQLKNASLA